MKSSPAANNGVARITAPSLESFDKQFVKASRPAVIQGAMDDWKAMSSWNAEYLADKVGDKRITVYQAPDGRFGLDPERGGPQHQPREMAIRDYVEKLLSDDETASASLYVQRLCIPELVPELMADFELPPYVQENLLYLTNLWFGPAGVVTKLHYDVPNNILAQVHGRKRFVLFPPRQTRALYPHRSKAYNQSQVDIEDPDLEKFTRFRQARPLEVVVEPGEMLFLPSFWWHQVYSLDTSMTINFWWMPRIRQLFAPQILDTWSDTLKEGARFFASRFAERRAS